ncbi:MAG: hypothetical protein KDA42_07790 [Planctomycetales bacterium]|nr:hypothetical protein [Planctomycetales bacterium]
MDVSLEFVGRKSLLVKINRRRLTYAGLTIAIVGVLLPHLIAATPLRNWVINRFITDPRLQASAQEASFGWLSNLRLGGVELVDSEATLQLSIAEVQSDRSWLRLWRGVPELGHFDLENPRLDLLIDASRARDTRRERASRAKSTFSVGIHDGELGIRVAGRNDPVVDLTGLQIAARVEPSEQGRFLVIDSSKVMEHHPLTPELTRDGLQLVAPMFARAVEMDGSLSVELLACRVPLDIEDDAARRAALELEGIVYLHRADARLKNPLLQAIGRLVALILQRDAIQHVRVADESQVHFAVREGRVFHEGLAFVLPDVAADLKIRTSGSVGLDESLDLTVALQLPAEMPLLAQFASKSLELHVTGTIDEPQLQTPGLEGNGLAGLIGQLIEGAQQGGDRTPDGSDPAAKPPTDGGEVAEAVVDLIGELIEKRRERREGDVDGDTPPGPTIFDRLRERRQQRNETRAKSGDSP